MTAYLLAELSVLSHYHTKNRFPMAPFDRSPVFWLLTMKEVSYPCQINTQHLHFVSCPDLMVTKVCEYNVLNLTCSTDQYITVHWANYGRTQPGTEVTNDTHNNKIALKSVEIFPFGAGLIWLIAITRKKERRASIRYWHEKIWSCLKYQVSRAIIKMIDEIKTP